MKRSHIMVTRSGAGAPPEPGPADQEACIICLSPRALGTDTDTILPCAHGFHQHCIQQWLADHADCPVCRTTVEVAGAGAGAEAEEESLDGDPDGVGWGAPLPAGVGWSNGTDDAAAETGAGASPVPIVETLAEGELAGEPLEGSIFIDGETRSVFRVGAWVPVDAEAEALLDEAVRTGRMTQPGEYRARVDEPSGPRVMVMPVPACMRWAGVPLASWRILARETFSQDQISEAEADALHEVWEEADAEYEDEEVEASAVRSFQSSALL